MADDDVVFESPVKSRAPLTELPARPQSRFVRREAAACQAPAPSGPVVQWPPPQTHPLLQPKPPAALNAVRAWASPGAEPPSSARHFDWVSAPTASAPAPRPSATAVPAATAVVRQGGLLSHGSADASVARLAPYVAAALPSLHPPRPCAPEVGPRSAGSGLPLPAPLLGSDSRGPGGAAPAPEPAADLARSTHAKKRCVLHTWLRARAALTRNSQARRGAPQWRRGARRWPHSRCSSGKARARGQTRGRWREEAALSEGQLCAPEPGQGEGPLRRRRWPQIRERVRRPAAACASHSPDSRPFGCPQSHKVEEAVAVQQKGARATRQRSRPSACPGRRRLGSHATSCASGGGDAHARSAPTSHAACADGGRRGRGY